MSNHAVRSFDCPKSREECRGWTVSGLAEAKVEHQLQKYSPRALLPRDPKLMGTGYVGQTVEPPIEIGRRSQRLMLVHVRRLTLQVWHVFDDYSFFALRALHIEMRC